MKKILFLLFTIFFFCNIFYTPSYFTDRFSTSGIIWIGITSGVIGILFALISQKIIISSLSCIIISSGIGILCYMIIMESFSFQQMTYGLSLYLVMIIGNNINEHLKIQNIYFLLLVTAQLEALFALIQWCKIWDTHFIGAHITGTFENSAGLSAYLSVCFPIALYFGKSNTIYKRLAGYTTALFFVIVIILSGSRTGIIALIVSSIFTLSNQRNIWNYLSLRNKIAGIIICITVLTGLYAIKKDSADGRMLIWRCTWEMIQDKPLLGHGPESFMAKYMNYQAEWFKTHPEHSDQWLADNIKHPFNEFLKLGAEYGFLGILFLIGLLIKGLFLYKQSTQEEYPAWYGLIALGVCSLFSYPFSYPSICCLLFFLLGILGRKKQVITLKPQYSIPIIGSISLYILSFTVHLTQMEIKWTNLVSASLNGQIVINDYNTLYSFMHENPYFLYNYGTELHKVEQWEKSIAIIEECRSRLNDTEVLSLLADNYYHTGDYEKAEQLWKSIKDMRPTLFLPLYNLAKLYIATNRESEALQLAHIIINKPIKIPSYLIYKIQKEMKQYIDRHN